jgi:hypothetical protein
MHAGLTEVYELKVIFFQAYFEVHVDMLAKIIPTHSWAHGDN